ncbi:MAG: hypothetical protein GY880_02755 [Planctomycetaceae bacterium]|nr:hypothetical protein [Planctomycetaceae bacterium]MCP4477318.1 hypothetical protein [Planctomycetaceae bacterium]MCP4773140.1 hypothetical protein [Planctomycetaceae bacterium]
MTPELQNRLDSSLPPFDGVCIRNSDVLTVPQLRHLLRNIIAKLSPQYPEICIFHDWHEHDGYIVDSTPGSWKSLTDATAGDRSLFESRDDDFEVRIAIFPPTFAWLLRYNIDQDDESDYNTATCDFDFSAANENRNAGLFDELRFLFPDKLEQCDALPWFKSNYGG